MEQARGLGAHGNHLEALHTEVARRLLCARGMLLRTCPILLLCLLACGAEPAPSTLEAPDESLSGDGGKADQPTWQRRSLRQRGYGGLEMIPVQLRAAHSGKCMDSAGATSNDGATIDQWTCGDQRNLLWWLIHAGNDTYYIRNELSGMCLAINSGTNAVEQQPCGYMGCNGTGACKDLRPSLQKFRIYETRVGSGKFSIDNPRTRKCVHVEQPTPADRDRDGARVSLWDCVAQDNVAWTIEPKPRAQALTLSTAGQCVGVRGRSSANEAVVEQQRCDSAGGWRLERAAATSNEYYLRSADSDRCLDVRYGSSADTAVIQQFECIGVPNERWRVVPMIPEDGFVALENVKTGKCLESAGAGVGLRQRACSGSSTQRFRHTPFVQRRVRFVTINGATLSAADAAAYLATANAIYGRHGISLDGYEITDQPALHPENDANQLWTDASAVTDRIITYVQRGGVNITSYSGVGVPFVMLQESSYVCDADGRAPFSPTVFDPTLFSHELGHYFGLGHTFGDLQMGFADQAAANLAYAADKEVFDGDGLSDTSPVPMFSYAAELSGTCDTALTSYRYTYDAGSRAQITVETDNVMSSYVSKVERISTQQAAIIRSVIAKRFTP